MGAAPSTDKTQLLACVNALVRPTGPAHNAAKAIDVAGAYLGGGCEDSDEEAGCMT